MMSKNAVLKSLRRGLLTLIVAVLAMTSMPVNRTIVKADTPTPVSDWNGLVAAVETGGEIVLTANIAAEGSLTVNKDVKISGNYTIFQEKRDLYDTLFKVNGGTLTLSEGLTLSGKIGECQTAVAKTLNDFATEKEVSVPGDAEPEEHTKDNPNAKTLDDFKKTTGATYTGVISGLYLRDAYGGKWLTSINQGGDINFTIDEQGRLKVGENEYFETNYQGARLKNVEPSNPLYARNTSGGTYNGEGTLVLYNSGLSKYFINPDPSSVSTGTLDEATKYTATMTASGGSTAWVIPDPDDGDKEKTYTTENDAKAALKKYNDAKYPGEKYYTVPGETSPEYASKDNADLIAAMETYNKKHPKTETISIWKIGDQEFINPDQQADAEQALEEYNNNLPSGCDLNNAACPVGDNAYTADKFTSGTTDNPHGFFVEVTGGTAVLDGAILENFNTSRDKGTTPKFVAPVVAKNGGTFNIESGSIKNNIVGYVVNDSKANESADIIKAYVKGAAPNAQRTAKRGAVRRNVEAGIDEGKPGSGITGTAGAVIYANGGTGTISGGNISFNRGDTGGIFVTGEGSKATLANGTNINNNVGVQFGGGTTVEDGGFIAMTGGSISQNVAWFGGGAVFATENGTKWLLKDPSVTIDNRKDGYFTMDGGTLDSNTAFTRGGAILADSDGVSLIKGTLSNNMARMLGGAVYVMGDHPDFTYTVYIEKGYVHENKAVSAGYKGTVATTASLPRYDKESNMKLSKKLVAPDRCNTPTSLFNGDMTVNSDDIQDGYPNNQKYSTDGTGGGIWLCSYGNTTLDLSEASQFYIDNNTATGSLRNGPISAPGEGGDDFHKDTKNNGSIIITGITAEDGWYDQNLGESGTIYAPADGEIAINDSGFRNLINKGDAKPEGYEKGKYANTTGVDIYGNLSRRGGGLAADGSFVFGKQQDTANLFAEMSFKKSWAAGIEKKPIAVKVYVETPEDKVEIATVPLTGIAKEASELDTVFDDGTVEGNYVGRLILPAFVEKRNDKDELVKMVQVFDIVANGQNIDLNSVEDLTALAKAIDENKEVKLSSEGRKIVFEEYVITGYDGNGAPILEKTDDFQLSPGKVSLSDLDAQIKTINQRQTDGSDRKVVTASFSEIKFNTDIANDKPAEIEKFVNEAVHKAIAVDEVFKYDIVAYVRNDADKIVITDTLVDELEFVSKAKDIKLYDLGTENNHKVTNNSLGVKVNDDATVAKVDKPIEWTGEPTLSKDEKQILKEVTIEELDNGRQELTVTLANELVLDSEGKYVRNAEDNQLLNELRGHWVKVSFEAQIKKELQDKIANGEMSVTDLQNVTVKASDTFKPKDSIYGKDEEGEEIYRPTPNKGNDPVESKENHDGIINTANYSIEVGNTPTYKDESNTVTVKPEEPEIEKYVNQAVHEFVGLDDVFTYDIIAYVTKDADKVEISDVLNPYLEFTDDDVKVVDLGLENNHKPVNNIYGEAIEGNENATVLLEGENLVGKPGVSVNKDSKELTVLLDDDVEVNNDTGAISRTNHTVEELRGHYIKVTFNAKFTEGVDVEELKNAFELVEVNNPVLSDETHDGIVNNAKYTIEVGNNPKYNESSNDVTVKPEIPEIEKYVNEAVHEFIDLDNVFKYDILAYVTYDADKVTITDPLNEQLEFAPDTEVMVYDLGLNNNHKVTNDINGDKVNSDASVSTYENKLTEGTDYALTTENNTLVVVLDDDVDSETGERKKEVVKNLRRHWVRVEFYAQIKGELRTKIKSGDMALGDLKFVTINDSDTENRDMPNVGNDPVISDEDHEGILNKASYTIDVKNEPKYEDESNTVTVKPEEPEIEKYVNEAVHEFVDMKQEFTYDVIAYVPNSADKVVIKDTLHKQLDFVSSATDVKVVDLGVENNHKVTNNIYSEEANTDATVASEGKKISDAVVEIVDGRTLTVTLDDEVTINEEAGTKTREKETVKKLRGHWVKVTFTAKIKEGLKKEDLERVEIVPTESEERNKPNVGNEPVISSEQHAGIPNKAEYTVTLSNEAEMYDESNTVTVGPETPEIEKYVNEAVHKDVELNEVFKYDIIAYITVDADSAVITDELDSQLQFVSTSDEVKVVDLGEVNNHKVTNNIISDKVNDDATVSEEGTAIENAEVNIDGATLTVNLKDAKALRGKWVKVTFEAKIKDGLSVKELNYTEVQDATEEDRATPNVGNDPVISDENHHGIPNKASYIINVANKAKYSDESNTVTVKPEEPEIEKYVNKAVHKDIDLTEEFTYDIIAYITKDADSFEITDELNTQLEFVSKDKDVKVVDLGTTNNHKPENNIASVKVNDDATVSEAGTKVDAKVTISGQKLTVNVEDASKLRGHWVKVTFTSKIKEGLSLSDLTYTSISSTKEENRAVPNVGNDPVLSEEDHRGVPNKASYTITVDNEAKYKDESNTVTVKPKEGNKEITVSKYWDDEYLEERRPESIKVHLLKDGVRVETAVITSRLFWTYTFSNLAEDGEYTIEEEPVAYYVTEVRGDADSGFTLINHTRPWIPETPDQEIENYGSFTYTKTAGKNVSKDATFKFEIEMVVYPGTPDEDTVKVSKTLKVGESETVDLLYGGAKVKLLEVDAKDYKVTYKVNDAKVNNAEFEIVANSDTKVEIHNDKPVPDTSDKSHLVMWSWMLLISLVIGGYTFFLRRRYEI